MKFFCFVALLGLVACNVAPTQLQPASIAERSALEAQQKARAGSWMVVRFVQPYERPAEPHGGGLVSVVTA